MMTDKLLPCPFCGGEARVFELTWTDGLGVPHDFKHPYYRIVCQNGCHTLKGDYDTEAEAIAAWNTRAAMEFDNWFYLPKPKEPIVEVTETTHAWDGTKLKTDVFYQVREQAVVNWAKELDEHIIKRICEVWDTKSERTCRMTDRGECSECGAYIVRAWTEVHDFNGDMKRIDLRSHNYCPNCGAKVMDE